MTVLGIETSGTVGSVALEGPSGVVREVTFSEGIIHGVALAPAVEKLLADALIAPGDLRAIAVGRGPGSWTGVRVGISFAKGFAFASGVPLVGVSSLAAMAAAAPTGRTVACVRDARRDTVYLELFDLDGGRPRPLGPMELLPLTEIGARLPREALVIGDAVDRFPDLLSGEGRVFGERSLQNATGREVARLGRWELAARGPDDPHDLTPAYLRPSEAEERRESGEMN